MRARRLWFGLGIGVLLLAGLGRALQRGDWAPAIPLPSPTGAAGASEVVRQRVEAVTPELGVCLQRGGVIRLDFAPGGLETVAILEPLPHDRAELDCVARAVGDDWPDVGTRASLRVVVRPP